MKVAVIGATGRTGRLIVDEARPQGASGNAYPVVGERPPLPIWILRRLLRTRTSLGWSRLLLEATSTGPIARLSRLTDGPAVGALHASPELLEHPAPISRRDVATLLVGLLESPGAVSNALNVTTAARA